MFYYFCKPNNETHMDLSEKLKFIRKMNGLTLDQVSMLLDGIVTKQAISKYERGIMRPSPTVLEALLKVYKLPPGAFENQKDITISKWNFRRPEGMSFQKEETLKSNIQFHLAHYLSIESMLSAEIPFTHPLNASSECSFEQMEYSSQELRHAWNLGNDSLPSICRIIELHGIKIIEMEWDEPVDGLCGWIDQKIPFIVLRRNNVTVERKRFTALHELAHILFPDLEKKDPRIRERLCHRFASSMLLPQHIIENYIGRKRQKLCLNELITLRTSYGISIAAIVHRLKDLMIITEEYYNHIFDSYINQNKMETGWGKYPFPDEANRYGLLLQRALSEQLLSPDDLSENIQEYLPQKIKRIKWL